jgi:hypothetical protein
MLGLSELVATLRIDTRDLIATVVAVYPRDTETGSRDAVGELLDRLTSRAAPALAEAVYRLMWSQIAFLVVGGNVGDLQHEVSAAILDCTDSRLEVRTLIFPLPDNPEQRLNLLDQALGELSSRRNFGSTEIDDVRRLKDSGLDAGETNERE